MLILNFLFPFLSGVDYAISKHHMLILNNKLRTTLATVVFISKHHMLILNKKGFEEVEDISEFQNIIC